MTALQSPNHTQTPNDLFDVHMADMKETELKVTMAVVRLTIGYHRKQARASISKIQKITGLSRQGVLTGAEAGERRGLIKREQDKGVTIWVVNYLDQDEEGSLNFRLEVVKNLDQSSLQNRPPSTKESNKENHIKKEDTPDGAPADEPCPYCHGTIGHRINCPEGIAFTSKEVMKRVIEEHATPKTPTPQQQMVEPVPRHILEDLEMNFCMARGVPEPDWSNPKKGPELQKTWRTPIKEIYLACNRDWERAKHYISETVAQMRKDKLTFTKPIQIREVALSMIADGRAQPETTAPTPDELAALRASVARAKPVEDDLVY